MTPHYTHLGEEMMDEGQSPALGSSPNTTHNAEGIEAMEIVTLGEAAREAVSSKAVVEEDHTRVASLMDTASAVPMVPYSIA
jgi:hypothetical protein